MHAQTQLCPCCSQKRYEECCYPYHAKEDYPQTASELMRSRYSAFVLKLAEYLIDTTCKVKNRKKEIKTLKSSIDGCSYVGLEILNTTAGRVEDKVGKVEFVATYIFDSKHYRHHELSRFKRYKGRWCYLDGELKGESFPGQ